MSSSAVLAVEPESCPASIVIGAEPVQFEPIIEDGIYHGMLVQSALERVALFSWRRIDLTLSDITRLRHALRRFHARRGLLYVSSDMTLGSELALLATLSKLAIVREESATM